MLESLMNCVICNSPHRNSFKITYEHITYDSMLDTYNRSEGNHMICEVCEAYVKRSRGIKDIFAEKKEEYQKQIDSVKQVLTEHKVNLNAELKQYVDMQFIEIKNNISGVLEVLDVKLRKLGDK